jgi:acyl transferase domain-containing protein
VFGISHAEAIFVDPQQRLLLECSLEAVISSPSAMAALAPRPPSSKAVGVYIGASYTDYALLLAGGVSSLPTYFSTGTSLSVIAGDQDLLPRNQGEWGCSASSRWYGFLGQ